MKNRCGKGKRVWNAPKASTRSDFKAEGKPMGRSVNHQLHEEKVSKGKTK